MGEEATMDVPDRSASRRGAQTRRDELAERVAWAVREDGTVETLEGLYLARSYSPTEPGHGVSTPAFYVTGGFARTHVCWRVLAQRKQRVQTPIFTPRHGLFADEGR